jgi:hypothetical protein
LAALGCGQFYHWFGSRRIISVNAMKLIIYGLNPSTAVASLGNYLAAVDE